MTDFLDRIVFVWVVLLLSHLVWLKGFKDSLRSMLVDEYKTNGGIKTVYFLTWLTYMASIGWFTHRVVWHNLLKWIG